VFQLELTGKLQTSLVAGTGGKSAGAMRLARLSMKGVKDSGYQTVGGCHSCRDCTGNC